MSHGRRRLVLGAAAAAWPVLAAWPARRAAAQSRTLRVGLLVSEAAEGAPAHRFVHEFREGMRELGREEGRNYSLQVRGYANERTAMALAAGQLAAARCDVVVAQSSAGAAALKGRTKVPLVVAGAAGPESPAGQVSGLLLFDAGLPARLTELARALLPRAKRWAFLCDPAHGAACAADALRVEAPRLAEQLPASQADGLIVPGNAGFFAAREAIVKGSLAAGLPALGPAAEFAELGALASYGCELAANFHAAARYVDRILDGARPADLPFQAPSRFELVLNMKTARELHLVLPSEAILRADRVIE